MFVAGTGAVADGTVGKLGCWARTEAPAQSETRKRRTNREWFTRRRLSHSGANTVESGIAGKRERRAFRSIELFASEGKERNREQEKENHAERMRLAEVRHEPVAEGKSRRRPRQTK